MTRSLLTLLLVLAALPGAAQPTPPDEGGRIRFLKTSSLAAMTTAFLLSPGAAGAVVTQEHGPASEPEHHAGAEAAHHGHPPNELALVLGGTYESDHEETFFTIGAEYERRLGKGPVSLSAVVEHISEVDAWVAVAPVVFRPAGRLKLATGPGAELKSRRPGHPASPDEHGKGSLRADEPGQDPEDEGDEALFLWRFGVGYSIPLGERFVLTPAVDLDLVREEGRWTEAVVFDVALGFSF